MIRISQPVTDIPVLNLRLDAVEELTQHEEMFCQVMEALKGFHEQALYCGPYLPSPRKLEIAG